MQATTQKSLILTALMEGEVSVEGQFLSGSNYTFLGQLQHNDLEFTVVYKPVRGEQPLWDFPSGTLSRREVAAYLISEALGWNLVPPTVFRRKLPLGAGSLQQYIQHDPEYHYFNFNEVDRERLQPVALFDLVINNADRKGSHILKDSDNHLWLIDHGVCFHEEDKIRTVVWDFSGKEIQPDLLENLRELYAKLTARDPVYEQLMEMISPLEIASMNARIRRLMESCRFPHPGGTHRPYPWPPV